MIVGRASQIEFLAPQLPRDIAKARIPDEDKGIVHHRSRHDHGIHRQEVDPVALGLFEAGNQVAAGRGQSAFEILDQGEMIRPGAADQQVAPEAAEQRVIARPAAQRHLGLVREIDRDIVIATSAIRHPISGAPPDGVIAAKCGHRENRRPDLNDVRT